MFFNPSSEPGIHARKAGRDLGVCGRRESRDTTEPGPENLRA